MEAFGIILTPLIIVLAIVIVISPIALMIRVGNVVKELRKLNKEFSKYTDWCYKNILTALKEK